jgi:hypothetical protein
MSTRWVLAFLLAVVVLVGVACGDGSEPTALTATPTEGAPATATLPATVPATPSPVASPNATAVSVPIKVFFSKHPESDDDPSRVFPVDRVSSSQAVARMAVEELIAGPTAAEQEQGYYSQFSAFEMTGDSNCAGEDFTISIENEVATIKFCRQLYLLGTLADARGESELRATLAQFPTVSRVVILNRDEHCLFDLSGLDLCKRLNTETEAVGDYVSTVGLDGQTFQLTDPIYCAEVEDIEAAAGKLCMDLAGSQLGDMSAVIRVDVYGTDAVWELSLEFRGESWVVTGAEYVGR